MLPDKPQLFSYHPNDPQCEGSQKWNIRCNWNLDGARRFPVRQEEREAEWEARNGKLGFVPVPRDKKCFTCAARIRACDGKIPCNRCNTSVPWIRKLLFSCNKMLDCCNKIWPNDHSWTDPRLHFLDCTISTEPFSNHIYPLVSERTCLAYVTWMTYGNFECAFVPLNDLFS